MTAFKTRDVHGSKAAARDALDLGDSAKDATLPAITDAVEFRAFDVTADKHWQ